MTDEAAPAVDIAELVKLSAVDNEIYARTFFPHTFRQASPAFQKEIWRDLDNPAVRYSNQRIFRGGAKTTVSRVFTSKRIAYGVSKTILYVGASEGAAARSGAWLRRAVERNKLWSGTFKLTPGNKWTDTEFEIWHETLQQSIYGIFVGITGNVRGINFDDWRPDLIVCDDVLTDENCASLDQREKITNLVYGALMKSLAPTVDDPNAKVAMLVTPQHNEDVSATAKRDPLWKTLEYGCWTDATKELDVEHQVSRWEERFPTSKLRKEKLAAIAINKLSTFTREMEVRITSPEQSTFLTHWLQYITEPGPVKGCYNVLSIDPTPPPSESQIAKGFLGDDFEVIHVWGRRGDDYFLQERRAARGESPDWTIANAFEMAMRYRVGMWIVESVAYQRTLKWLLEKEMKKRRQFYQILPFIGGNKYAGIRSVFAGPASHGHIWVRPTDTPFIEQFETYPSCDHDDELDAGRIALGALINPFAAAGGDENTMAEVEDMPFSRGAP
jgi:predicted phage terminase large subunit-like protein